MEDVMHQAEKPPFEAAPEDPQDAVRAPRGHSLWHDAWGRLLKNRMAMFGLGVLVVIVLTALIGPFISPYTQEQTNFANNLQAPSWQHWLGTDNLGRDLLVRIMQGTRISLAVGVIAALVSLVIGVTYGSIAGFMGGRVDNIMMRIVDMLYCLPFMFFVILLMIIAGRNIINLFIALGAIQWLTLSRITRGQILSLKQKAFIEAAHAIGLKKTRIIFRHLIPNVLGPVVVYATLTVPAVMLEEAFLSFLGLGVQAPQASLGSLVAEGAEVMEYYPWLMLFPGAVLALTLFCLNFLGDGLRDAIDPQVKRS